MKKYDLIKRLIYNLCLICALCLVSNIQVRAEKINIVSINKNQLCAGVPLQVTLADMDAQDVQYRWYRDDKMLSGYVDASYLPTEKDYEHWIKVEVLSGDEVIGNDRVYFSKLPVAYINTADGDAITSKTEYKDGNMYIQGNEEYSSQYDGEIEIKGRGSSSWKYPQKPYKIKLDKSTNLFGFGKNKHWVLISPHLDQSLMRNKIAYDLSGELGLVQMQLTWVDVILNGDYAGNYALCEQIRVADDRISIFSWGDEIETIAKKICEADDGLTKEDQKAIEKLLEENLSWITSGKFTYENNTYVIKDYYEFYEDISGGYLFELSAEYDEESKFKTSGGILVMLNTPEYLNTNDKMFKYVQDYWQQFEDGICSVDGYDKKGKHYQELADFDSMLAYWLTMEIMGNDDAHYKSRYAYKDSDGLLTFGPVWDFDWGCGSCAVGTDAEGWKLSYGTLWKDFIDDPYFCVKAAEKYWSIRDYLEEIIQDDGMIDTYYEYLYESGRATDKKYPQPTCYGHTRRGFENDVEELKTYLKNRFAWLDEQFASASNITASLYMTESTNPYTRSEEELSISLTNTVEDSISRQLKVDGILAGKNKLAVELTVKDENTSLVSVYVNGYKYEENIVVASGKAHINIAASRFMQEGLQNVISFIGKNANGKVTYTNFATVFVKDFPQENIVSYDYSGGTEGTAIDTNAISGIYADGSILSASLDGGVYETALAYSAPEYTEGDETNITVPIMAASQAEPWSKKAYFEIACSTKGYEDLVFSASLGATKQGPRDYKLQYSLDKETWTDVPSSTARLTKAKVMQKLFSRIFLPLECSDNSVLYIRIAVASNKTLGGDTLKASTVGEAAINHIAIYGIKTELSYAEYKSVLKIAKSLEAKDYINFEILEKALKADVYREDISQDEIDAAVEAIEDAIRQLQKKKTDEDGGTAGDKKNDDPNGNISKQPDTGNKTPAAKGTVLSVAAKKCKVIVISSDKKNPLVAYKGTTDKKASKLTIPDSVTVNGVTYKVSSIADGAFANNKKLTKVIIGKNVVSIGKNAFRNCSRLKIVKMKTTILNKIGANAFRGAKKLTNVTLNTSILTKKSIGANVLKGTNKKLVIKVPKKMLRKYQAYFKVKGNKKITVKK